MELAQRLTGVEAVMENALAFAVDVTNFGPACGAPEAMLWKGEYYYLFGVFYSLYVGHKPNLEGHYSVEVVVPEHVIHYDDLKARLSIKDGEDNFVFLSPKKIAFDRFTHRACAVSGLFYVRYQ